MWILYALGSAFFAGITAILAKCGIKNTDSNVATAIRTFVVLIFSWVMVFIVGSQDTIGSIDNKTFMFLILSGLATGASWLCYFKALQLGDINKVVPIDKSSIILTIIMAFAFLGEGINLTKIVAVIFIGMGTYLMIQKKGTVKVDKQEEDKLHKDNLKVDKQQNPSLYINKTPNKAWLVYALLSAVFASLTAILGKVGISGVESNLGTAIRTVVVLAMAWIVVFLTGKQNTIKLITKKELVFIILSGLATGASWLCYYKALQDGLASVVVSIDKLSIIVTIGFSYIVFNEKLSKKSAIGLALIVAGTLAMILKL